MVEIPTDGLERHENLRYLLLENNRLNRLPCEVGTLRHLAALSLENNPLEYPPSNVNSKGLKTILEFLRKDYTNKKQEEEKRYQYYDDSGNPVTTTMITNSNSNNNNDINNYFYNYYDDSLATEDVWASDPEDEMVRRARSGRVQSSRSRSTCHS